MSRLLIFFLLFFSSLCDAQNLVPNGSFEEYSACPKYNGQLYLANGWYNPTIASPDLYHVCSNTRNHSDAGVPKHPGGYQFPHSGEGYGAFIPSSWPASHPGKNNYREYISTKLLAPLAKGKKYCVTMYIAISKSTKYAIDQLSVYFSKDSVYQYTSECLANVTPQLNNLPGVYLDDTTRWQKITWEYQADDAYQWMTIGNFNDYDHTQSVLLRNIPDMDCTPSYYYVDDISVVPIPGKDGWLPDQVMPCSAAVNVSAGYFDEYLWSTGAISPDISIDVPGTYWVSVKNSCGTYTDTFSVEIKDTTTIPFVVSDQQIICGNPVKVILDPYDAYEWSTGDITSSITVNIAGTYWVTVKNKCGTYSDTFAVKHVDTTTTPFFIQDEKIYCHKPVTISLSSYDNYLWSTGATTSSVTINSQGMYWATVTNNCGTYSDTFKVRNEGCLFVPSAFSPDGDGLNDVFRPRGIIYPHGYVFSVYNRWGQQVFVTTDINSGWNGMHGASLADIGVYYWYINYINTDNEAVTAKGDVTIIR